MVCIPSEHARSMGLCRKRPQSWFIPCESSRGNVHGCTRLVGDWTVTQRNDTSTSSAPGPVNEVFLGNRIWADVIKIRWGHPRWGWPCPCKKQKSNGDLEEAIEDGGGDWRDTASSPQMPGPPGAGRGRRDPPSEPLKGAQPWGNPDFKLLTSRTVRK